jgi:hypothetical protein
MSELYRPSDRCLSGKLVPTFADRGCHVVCVTDSYSCILGFLVWTQFTLLHVNDQKVYIVAGVYANVYTVFTLFTIITHFFIRYQDL